MSFILDALRRAEAQRERGQVPGLHSQSVTTAAPDAPAPRARASVVGVLGALCALLTVALVALWWWREPAQTPVPLALPTPVSPASSPLVAHAPASAPPASAAAPTAPTPAPVPPPPVQKPPPVTRLDPAKVSPPHIAPAPRVARPMAASAASTPASAAAPLLSPPELPEPWRSTVTRLGVTGAVHSSDPTQSFVMVGGQLAHEGDRVAPDISIERIGPRATVLRAGPHRVEIRY